MIDIYVEIYVMIWFFCIGDPCAQIRFDWWPMFPNSFGGFTGNCVSTIYGQRCEDSE
jgi:hypothetical protein